MAELRHVEAELETDPPGATTRPATTLHARAGRSWPSAALEVSRLEERIRYVVEARQRVQLRVGELNAQNIQWDQRRAAERGRAGAFWPSRSSTASARQPNKRRSAQSHAATLPAFEDTVRMRLPKPMCSAKRWIAVQQRIQLLAAGLTQSARTGERAAHAARALSSESDSLKAPEPQRLADIQVQAPQLEQRHHAAEARLHELQEQMPALDEHRRAQHDEVNLQSAKQADLAARMTALRALQEKSRPRASSSPGWPSMAWKVCRGCGRRSTSSPVGKPRSNRRCANGSTHCR